jgi:hypothetical protein
MSVFKRWTFCIYLSFKQIYNFSPEIIEQNEYFYHVKIRSLLGVRISLDFYGHLIKRYRHYLKNYFNS